MSIVLRQPEYKKNRRKLSDPDEIDPASFHFLNFDDLGLDLFSVPVPEPLVLPPPLDCGFAAILTDFLAEPTGRFLVLGVFGVVVLVPLLGVFLLLFSDVVVARPIFAISLVMSTTALETLFLSPF